jgi:hypothetical protein
MTSPSLRSIVPAQARHAQSIKMNAAQTHYDAFMSYSHEGDNQTAAKLQRALQRIAKPWYRLRGMRVFRDETDLSAEPEGWQAIQAALAQSRFLIFMASKRAAASGWVAKELAYWIENRSAETLLIALTDGDIVWDNERGDFDWERTKSLPRQLSGAFHSEPIWVDLRWTNERQILTFRNPEFVKAVAKLAAPVRNLDIEALVSEDHKQHRRTLVVAYGAAAALVTFLGIALWQTQSRIAADERERDQHVLASVARAYRVLSIDPLQAVDEARAALAVKKSSEGEEALRTAIEFGLRRRESRQDEREVLGSGFGYLMERWRRGDVFTRLRKDGRYALVASERGKDGLPPGNVYLISMDNLRTKELQPGDRAKGRRLEFMGFSSSGKEIFLARQFYLDIYDLEGNRTKSVQLEFHAKPTHMIAGMFGSYVLVGDTVGHVMLADTSSDKRPQLKGGRYRDAVLFIESNSDANRAIVVFESGRAELVVIDDPSAPAEFDLQTKGTMQAAFGPAPHADRFLTTSRTGWIDVWQLMSGIPARLASFNHGDTPVGLASFSSDGRRVISLGNDSTYKVWDVASQALVVSYGPAVIPNR